MVFLNCVFATFKLTFERGPKSVSKSKLRDMIESLNWDGARLTGSHSLPLCLILILILCETVHIFLKFPKFLVTAI